MQILPFHSGSAEILVGECVDVGAVLRDVEHARSQRQGIPAALGIAEVRRNHRVEHRRLDRLGDAGVDQVDEVAEVDGHQHVGGGVVAFGGDPFRQAGIDENGVDFDAALRREGVEEGLDQARLARGVEIDLAGGERRGRKQRQDGEGKEAPNGHERHPDFAPRFLAVETPAGRRLRTMGCMEKTE